VTASAFAVRDSDEIRVAVVGAGRMGRVHIANLAAIRNARTVVVADANAAAAEAGRDLARTARASADPLEAIRDPEVDAVVIVTPASTHATLIEAALRAGKAVWTEKPIAQSMAETARIVAAWRATRSTASVSVASSGRPDRVQMRNTRRGRMAITSSATSFKTSLG
jgi:predicted dehydrogenase